MLRGLCYHRRMEITEAQYEKIAPCLPIQRGNVRIPNRQLINALLYRAGKGNERV